MIILQAQIESVSTRKDRTVKVVIGTQELTPNNAATIFALQNKLASVAIADKDLTETEIETLRQSKYDLEDVPNGKTPSQRLRGVFYRMWEQDNKGYNDFNLYYINRMENLIEHYKQKLD